MYNTKIFKTKLETYKICNLLIFINIFEYFAFYSILQIANATGSNIVKYNKSM